MNTRFLTLESQVKMYAITRYFRMVSECNRTPRNRTAVCRRHLLSALRRDLNFLDLCRADLVLPPYSDRARDSDGGVGSGDRTDKQRERESPQHFAAKKHKGENREEYQSVRDDGPRHCLVD